MKGNFYIVYFKRLIEHIKISSSKNWKQLENRKEELNVTKHFEIFY